VRVPVAHHPAYVSPLPESHRFPMPKFGRLFAYLCQTGLVLPQQVVVPEPAPRAWLELAHTPRYVAAVLEQRLEPAEERRLGLPMSQSLSLRARCAVAGTVLAARLALEHGLACNTAGGSHHAYADFGSGFCVFNDVAVAARVLLAEGHIHRALVVDLDVHQGDGTADLLAGDDEAFLLSIQGGRNYPFRRIPADLDIDLRDGAGDDAYLEALAPALERAVERSRPELVIYDAAADPFAGDRLGRLALSFDGLAARDAHVLDRCRGLGLPVLIVLGGGYAVPIEDTVRIHVQTLARAATYAGTPPRATYAASHAAPAASSSRV
jgi:acetoin utilization deacetylase AcuC-like enzyme